MSIQESNLAIFGDINKVFMILKIIPKSSKVYASIQCNFTMYSLLTISYCITHQITSNILITFYISYNRSNTGHTAIRNTTIVMICEMLFLRSICI